MSQFDTIRLAYQSIQIDHWTPVVIDHHTVSRILRDTDDDELEEFKTDDDMSTVHYFLGNWCRKNIKCTFATKHEGSELILYFKHSSEAVRFKLTWGGR